MSVEKRVFGKTPQGQEIMLYTISNGRGMKASVSELGAILVELLVPDQKGKARDVVLGFDGAAAYYDNPSFFGSTIGPSANRIAGAKFALDGVTCLLDVNDGPNNLHSHREQGYHKRIWQATATENSVTFTLEDKDGSMGFPGNKRFQVTYELNEDNALKLVYHAESDKRTVLNPTNHSYFNLDGQGSGTVLEHTLQLNASRYTPVAAGSIPTGELASVAGTPMDFTREKKIGQEIDADFEQLRLTTGYDHNWVIDGWDGTLRHFATVGAAESGIRMEVYTTLPGVQFYAGNYIDPQEGKGGAQYAKRYALCLETQYFPDSVNEPEFPSCIFGAGKEYDSETVYKFI